MRDPANPNTIRWSLADFENKDIPEDARRSLMEIGLPEFIPNSTFEFGLFDSDGSELVIGVDSVYPILVRFSGIVEIEGEVDCWFYNSSIRQLIECLAAYERMHQPAEGEEDTPITGAREEIEKIDPMCLQRERSIWREVVEYLEGLAQMSWAAQRFERLS